jgi:hypothetical protein
MRAQTIAAPRAATQPASFAPPSRASLLQRKCACGGAAGLSGECEECREKQLRLQARSATAASPVVPSSVHEVLRAPGIPLDSSTRVYMEARLGHDFSRVRVHVDEHAARSTEAVGALAYAVGRDVAFASGFYAPHTPNGRKLLVHELTHVMQQGELSSPNASTSLRMSSPDDAAEREADTVASAPVVGSRTPPVTRMEPALMRLTPADFRAKLGATTDEKTAIGALFADAEFKPLWDYVGACPSKPKKDLGPLGLEVTPGLKIGGVERYGGYSPGDKKLEINPTKPEHVANPQELVDTIVHELIHAVDDLDNQCVKDGAKPSPLKGAGTASPPALAVVKGKADEDKWLTEAGPGASNPCEEFIDINKQAQQIIVGIIQRDIKSAKVGRPTITFLNDAIRKNPKALADYKICRDAACAEPKEADRNTAIAKCSDAIMAKYATAAPAAAPPKKP